jgi:nicotinic acid mononucleotide adenylyltransferase
VARRALSPAEVDIIHAALAPANWTEAGWDGRTKEASDPTGSLRAAFFSDELGEILWERLKDKIPKMRLFTSHSHCDFPDLDHPEQVTAKPFGINPLFRVIRYPIGGGLIPHRDSSYITPGNPMRRTLMSVVVCLRPGTTRFLLDPERHKPVSERNLNDQWLCPLPDAILAEVTLEPGDLLIFDHRLLHDSKPVAETEKLLLRSDLLFELGEIIPRSKPPVRQTPASESGLATDPAYHTLWRETGSLQTLRNSGWLQESDTGSHERLRGLGIWSSAFEGTPLTRLLERLELLAPKSGSPCEPSDARPWVVLVATGSFAPLHEGHLALLKAARTHLESMGREVLGAFLSPCHESYVAGKIGDPASAHALTRIAGMRELLHTHDWIEIDPWEALHSGELRNFTTVCKLLEQRLSAQLGCLRPVEIMHVHGSDHAEFTQAFRHHGSCVLVPRPGYPIAHDVLAGLKDVSRIHIAAPSDTDISSSTIRKNGGHAGTRPRIDHLHLRSEGVTALFPKVDPSHMSFYQDAYSRFESGLIALLQSHLPGTRIQVHRLAVQLERLRRLLAASPRETCLSIVLDAFAMRAFHQEEAFFLPLPRVYGLASAFESRHSRVAAPEIVQELNRRIHEHPARERLRVRIVDDDRHTGRTLQAAQELLEKTISQAPWFPRNASAMQFLMPPWILNAGATDSSASTEILDLRDFLWGTERGGLFVRDGMGRFSRKPYQLPWVWPDERASIPPERLLEFCLGLERLNQDFLIDINPIASSRARRSFQPQLRARAPLPAFPAEH